MPSGTEHVAPLVLVTGADAVLRILVVVLVLLGLVAIASNPLEAMIGGFLFFASGLALVGMLFSRTMNHSTKLSISQYGNCRIGGAGGLPGLEGSLDRKAWLSHWYSVLRVTAPDRRRFLLVSASRQPAGEYRKLQCWMHHRSFH